MEYIGNQKTAIETRNKNILVSAGAGCGKTTVLTQRIYELICEGNNITDFLICTFTNDAARSMQEKITNKLIKNNMQDMAELVAISNISTFHAFCQKIISENFATISLPCNCNIVSDNEEHILQQQALEKTLNNLYQNDIYANFAIRHSQKNDSSLKELIIYLHNKISSIPNGIQWLKNLEKKYANKDFQNVLLDYCNILNIKLKELLNGYNNIDLAHLETVAKENQLSKIENIITNDIDNINEAIDFFSKGEFYIGIKKLYVVEKSTLNGMFIKTNAKYLNDIRKPMNDIYTLAFGVIEFLNDEELLKALNEDFSCICAFIYEYENQYTNIKLNNKSLTFNDLEKYTFELLQNQEISKEYKSRFKFIFVDEYQDTSQIQQAIIEKLSSKDNVFFVGDIKQSIYGFRNSDPDMFYTMYNDFKTQKASTSIDLSTNFRSTKPILDFVNHIFNTLLNINNQFYPKDAHLIANKTSPNESVDIVLIDNDKNKIENESIYIIKKIKELIDSGYSFKDIAILTSVNDAAEQIVNTLSDYNIPAYCSGSDKRQEYVEIGIFLNYIKLINNPYDDIALLSVLYSPIVNLTMDDIIKIRLQNAKSIYQDVLQYMDENDDEISSRLKDFNNKLFYFMEKSKYHSVFDLLSMVIKSIDFIKYLQTTKEADSKINQLYNILQFARQNEEKGNLGLLAFLDYYSKLKKDKKSFKPVSFTLGSDVVRVMTIHKSKGLEFPVVFMCNLNKEIQKKSKETFDKNIGIGLKIHNIDYDISLETFFTRIIAKKSKQNKIEESMRLLYVACTRAMEKLIIVSSTNITKLTKDIDAGNWFSSYITALFSANPEKFANIQKIDVLEPIEKNIKVDKVIEKHENLIFNNINPKIKLEKRSVTSLAKKDQVEDIYKFINSKRKINESDEELIHRLISNHSIPNNIDILKLKEVNTILQTDKNEGAIRGTIIHNLLTIAKKQDTANSLLKRAKDLQILSENDLLLISDEKFENVSEYKENIFENLLQKYLDSDIFKEISSSNKVYYEKPFMLNNNDYILQGIIDCLYKHENGYVIVDFKTDKNPYGLKQKYENQLNLYAKSVEEITKEKVIKKVIYHFNSGQIILC